MNKTAKTLGIICFSILVTTSCIKEIQQPMPPMVEAGPNMSIKVSSDSVLLTSHTTNDNGQIASYLWTKESGPGTPEILSPISASTWVKGLKTGSYTFRISVKNVDGEVAADTVAVEVLAVDTVTFAAAPTNNPTEVHLFGNENGIDQTHPGAPEIMGASGTYLGDPVNIRALLSFDLSTIPEGAKIVSAKLTLFSNPTPLNGIDGNPNYGSDNTLLIQRVENAWDYQNINWLNQPSGLAADQIEIPHTDEPTLDLVDVDVKKLVEAMMADGNNGFLIKLKTEAIYNFRIFCSSKYVDATKHPKLEVVYAY